MTILVVTVGSFGDVLPLLGLAKRLQERGHDVTFFTNGYFSELIQQSGVPFVPIGATEDYESVIHHPNMWHSFQGFRLIMERLVFPQLREAYDSILSHVKAESTILISSHLGWAARLVQETHHFPNVSVHFGRIASGYTPLTLGNIILPEWVSSRIKPMMLAGIDVMLDAFLKPSLNRVRQDLGLPPVSRIFFQWRNSPDLVLGLFPDWFDPPQADWPSNTMLAGFPLYDEAHDAILPNIVREFLSDHPAPIVFTPGTANTEGHAFFNEAAKACQLIDRPGIFLTRYPEQIPRDLPASIRHFSYVPLSRLLSDCAALVHHGGIGTCSQAMQAGIPQLIQPLAFDQFGNAARIEKLGIGARISQRDFQRHTIATKIQGLLTSPQIQAECLKISEWVKQADGLSAACDIICQKFDSK